MRQSQIDAVESLPDASLRARPEGSRVAACAGCAEPAGADARLFRRQARRKYRPSTGRRIDVASLYADGVAGLPDTLDGRPPLPVPRTCPINTIDGLPAEP